LPQREQRSAAVKEARWCGKRYEARKERGSAQRSVLFSLMPLLFAFAILMLSFDFSLISGDVRAVRQPVYFHAIDNCRSTQHHRSPAHVTTPPPPEYHVTACPPPRHRHAERWSRFFFSLLFLQRRF